MHPPSAEAPTRTRTRYDILNDVMGVANDQNIEIL